MEVNTIAVIGANAVGRVIATAVALAGYRTILEDVSREMLERSMGAIKRSFDESVERGELAPEDRHAALSCIHSENTIEAAIRDADLIIETVPEELEMKLELFTIFDKFAKPGAIFASTTSVLSILDISDVTVYRERCIGLRFSDALRGTKWIEVTRTELTSAEVIGACEEVGRRTGREVRVVWDAAAAARDVKIPEA
jgi:3-hydroxyacyl-CoA dehydrogenase